jgi:exodeoxyribonuclease VII large subunit
VATAPTHERILTVTEVTRRIKEALEGFFPGQWVRGEISGWKKAASGHFYFSLKDRNAQLDCFLHSKLAAKLKFPPRDGLAVDAYGRIEVWEQRGRYQLNVEGLRPAGLGERLVALEELKKRLQEEGLFDTARKRPLPPYPRRIGLVTSPVGAAIRDLTSVLRARWPSIGIVLAPVKVQGEGAAIEIADAIRRFDRWGGVDLLIVGRGGGSIEDLWAFNEEPVVRAIVASRIPVISAVGHEADVTLADLAADVRAATPSNAAERAVRDWREIAHRVEALRRRLGRALRHTMDDRRQRLDHALEKYGFRNLLDVFGVWRRAIDGSVVRLRQHMRRALDDLRRRVEAASGAYGLREWPRQIATRRADLVDRRERLSEAMAAQLESLTVRARAYADRLRALSPRLVMERGYCLVRGPEGTLLRASDGLAVGDEIHVEFARGEADARVETVRTGEDHGH